MSLIANAEKPVSEGWKQFVKFAMIGASSAVLDIGISQLLMHRFGMYWLLANTISALVAISNGYLWNSLWTFRGMGSARRHTQYLKFVAVSLVGLVLNSLIMTCVILMLAGHIGGNPPHSIWVIAKGTAIVLVATWNFLANKRWTFAEPRE